MNANDDLTFNFIRDEPAKEDSFGSHDRVARAIASVIRSAQEFKVIGLLGPWGAGKSTVVKLTEAHLKTYTDIETHLFYYDAWLHQNDPPRRSFLETLIHFLAEPDRKLTTLDDWQDRLDQLHRKVEDSETTSTPTLTASGRLIAASLLLWTVALPFVSHDWYKAAFDANGTASDFWPFVIALLVLFLPFAIAASFYIGWRPIKSPLEPLFWEKTNWVTHKSPHENESILSIVTNKEVQRQRSRVTRTPDPTAIEFQDIFREIIEKVSSPKRRFLFVIDNLDRLAESEALTLWGTIRSFFLGAQETNKVRKIGRLPTVVLPIDRDAVERMYRVQHGDDASDLAKSFMDKTFDLTFRVTRPVLSDWNTYLTKQMASVLGPAMPKDWSYLTSRLYERFFAGQPEPNVTPRTINTLINDIAALWLQWRATGVSFVSVAYYAIWQRDISRNILAAVASPQLPGIADLDPDWQKNIAALHYGARPSEAAQILIEQPLLKAITDRDKESFAQLEGMPSFDRVLQRQFDQYIATDGIDFEPVRNSIFLLNTISGDGQVWLDHAWRSLRIALRRSSGWRSFGEEEVEALNALTTRCPPGDLAALLQTIETKLAGLSPETAKDPQTAEFIAAFWREASEKCKANGVVLPAIRIPGTADAYLRVAGKFCDSSTVLQQLRTTASDVEVVQELANVIADKLRAAGAEAMFDALLAIKRSWPWAPLLAAAVAVVRDQNANHPGAGAGLLFLGLLRASDKTAKNYVNELYQNGPLLNRLSEAFSAGRDIVTARAAVLILLNNPNVDLPGKGNWNSRFNESPQLIEMIDTALVQFDNANNWESLVSAAANYPAWSQIARAVVSRRIREKSLGPIRVAPVIADTQQYLACVEDSLQTEFVSDVAQQKGFWDELKNQPFAGNVLTIVRLLIQTQEFAHSTVTFAASQLEQVNADVWMTAIRNGGEPMLIANDLTQLKPLQLGTHLLDALQSLVQELISNSDAEFRARWFTAAKYLRANARRVLFKAVRDRIHSSGSSVTDLPALLTAGGDEFLELSGVGEEPDAAVRHIVLTLLNDSNGLDWLEGHFAPAKEWIARSDDSSRDVLGERLREKMDGDAAAKERLEGLRRAWGLPEITSAQPDEPVPNAAE